MKDCKTCIWFGKEKPGQCGNYLCRNQSEYDPRTGVEEADPWGESEGKAVSDYIKRADVLELVMRGNLVSNRNYKSVTRLIMGIPAADVRPVTHGKWIDVTEQIYINGLPIVSCYRCNQCEGTKWETWTKFCPHCGAEMDGVE